MRRPRDLTNNLTLLQFLSLTMVAASILLLALARFGSVLGIPDLHSDFTNVQASKRPGVHVGTLVHLDYASYEGVHNTSTALNVFKGQAVTSALPRQI